MPSSKGLDAFEDSNPAVSTSQNITEAFIKSRRLEKVSLKSEIDDLIKQQKKTRLFNERRKAAFMQSLKGRRKEWWKFDTHVREGYRKEFDGIILRKTKSTIKQFLQTDSALSVYNENEENTRRSGKQNKFKSDSLGMSSFNGDDKNSIISKDTRKTFDSIKLPSILSKLSNRDTPDYYYSNNNINQGANKLQSVSRLTNNSSVLDTSRRSYNSNEDIKGNSNTNNKLPESDSLLSFTKLKTLPNISTKLTKSMSQMERHECLEFIKTTGFSNNDEEAFFDTADRFLKRTPFYIESKDHFRKCQSETAFRNKCKEKEKQVGNIRDDRFDKLMELLKPAIF